MLNKVITIIYEEDLACGYDLFFVENGVQMKETFLMGDEKQFLERLGKLLESELNISNTLTTK